MADPFFDTNILVDWLRGNNAAADELGRYARHRISRIVWTEVLAGEPLDTRPRVQQLLSAFEIVEVDGRIASAAADLRHRSGMRMLDALVLASAQVHGAILVTRDTHAFPAAMPGIRVPYSHRSKD